MTLFVFLSGWAGCVENTDDRRLVTTDSSVLPLGTTRVVHLNRAGGDYRKAEVDSSKANLASVLDVDHTVTLPPFRGDEATWRAIENCVVSNFASYNIRFVREEPDIIHNEIAVGGHDTDLELDNPVYGLAPMRTDCKPLERSVGFVFSETFGNDVEGVCYGISHELGHILGLDHAIHCDENMSYLGACTSKGFRDEALACGGDAGNPFERRPCQCGETQNSHAHLMRWLGPPIE